MIYLTVAVVIVGALSVFNLVLAFAVIRWVQRRGSGRRAPLRPLPTGAEIADFSVTAMSGMSHSLGDMRGGRSLAAFLSPSCGPCREQLPELVRLVRAEFPDPAQVLVTVRGNPDAVAEFTADLRGLAVVAHEPARGPAQQAFSVQGVPRFFILDEDGNVEVSGVTVRSLAVRQFA